MVNIYVLELEGGNYYVGKTRHTFDRFDQHREGSGARWTKLHPVVGLYTFHKDRRDSDENMFTILMMKNFGIDKVRGGSWTNPEISDRSRKKLEKRISRQRKRKWTYTGLPCSRCGRDSHPVEHCFASFHTNGKALNPDRIMVDADVYDQYLEWRVEQLRQSSAEDGKEVSEEDIQDQIESINEISEKDEKHKLEIIQALSEERDAEEVTSLIGDILKLTEDVLLDAVHSTKKTIRGTKKKAIRYGKRVDKIGRRATKEFRDKTAL